MRKGLLAGWIALLPFAAYASNDRIAGVTFSNEKGAIYVSAKDIARDLRIPLEYDRRSDLAFLGSIPLDYHSAVGDQRFVSLAALTSLGAKIETKKSETIIRLNGNTVAVRVGKKTATVDKRSQQIKVFQGGSLVLTSRVSTGKYTRSTPTGTFRIGTEKDAYHSSAKYDDAPMPWAVHVVRNIFIHGGVVPDYPASHGCIRLPEDAAIWFYNWAEPGTVVTIRD